MQHIRPARPEDAGRIAEILVFNNRVNFYPIFKSDEFSFGEVQVLPVATEYQREPALSSTYVYDDGVIRGMIRINQHEVEKLFVDTFFQGRGIGAKLLEYAIATHEVNFLWALEKNIRAISFYQLHGFRLTDDKKLEEGTTEYLVKLVR